MAGAGGAGLLHARTLRSQFSHSRRVNGLLLALLLLILMLLKLLLLALLLLILLLPMLLMLLMLPMLLMLLMLLVQPERRELAVTTRQR